VRRAPLVAPGDGGPDLSDRGGGTGDRDDGATPRAHIASGLSGARGPIGRSAQSGEGFGEQRGTVHRGGVGG